MYGIKMDNYAELIQMSLEMDENSDPEQQQSLLSLFQVDLENFLKIKFGLMYHLHLHPDACESWPFWEFEIHVEQLADVLKKKQEAEKGQGDSMNQQSFSPQKTAEGFMKKAQSNVPKVPSMRMPKF